MESEKTPILSTENRKKPFGIRDSIAYAAGDLGCNMSFALKGTMMIFWTQFMHLELWYALLLVIVQVWDAINDPLIGSLIDSDKRQYKRNKFLTYIFVGSIGLIVAGALCFLPFPNAPVWAQMIIFVGGYIVWDACYTVANVPYGSLLSLISDAPSDRASLSAWRSVGAMVGNIIPMVVLPFIIYDSNNNLIGTNVFLAALVMGAMGFIFFQFMIRNTVVRVDTTVKCIEDQPKFNLFHAFKNFAKNRPAIGATVAAMGTFLGMSAASAATAVLFQSYFQNTQISGIVNLFAMLPIILFTPLARKMVAKYGKKELSVIGSLVSLAACLLMVVLPIGANMVGVALFTVCMLINSLGMGIHSTVSWAMMGDAIDYNGWKNGAREEGTTYALHSFFRKLAQGVGPALALAIMVGLGYVGSKGAFQDPQVALNMRYLVPALYMVSAVLSLIGLGLIYNLDKKTLAVMHDELSK